MAKCRHRKGLILACANYVVFTPDQEPFISGVIEKCGIESIRVESLNIHYCPKCKAIQDVEQDGEVSEVLDC